jgi:hypothetical protein
MGTADEYRQFANECLRWATEVETEDDRQSFLDMARDWTLAAMRLDGLLIADGEVRNAPNAPDILSMVATPQQILPQQSGASEQNK